MHEYLAFLRSNLFNDKEFALIALPVSRSEYRRLYEFTKHEDYLVDTAGNRLTLRPFVDSELQRAESDSEFLEKEHYLTITQRAIDSIRAGKMDKVVLARTRTIEHCTKASLVSWYVNLLEKYPQSFVFIVSTKESGLWIGASPELLVEKSGTRFHTIALAATKASLNPLWSPKEYDEHRQVVSYINRKLKRPGITDVAMTDPYTYRYGKVTHLKTDISFSSNQSLEDVVRLIHPTPALCGNPLKEALQFIQRNEARPRDFYTGSAVIEGIDGNGVAFALLRCGKLDGRGRLILYAGCGIVADSIPKQEWEESELKIASVLTAFS